MIRSLVKAYRKNRELKKLFKQFRHEKEVYNQFVEYVRFEVHLPALHVIKQNNIRKYKDECGFRILVETGTYLGDMVYAQLDHFKKIFSIELSDKLYQDAVEKFEKFPEVKILHGDSGVLLTKLLQEIHEPALFWLDGHYSSGITARGNKATPILAELQTILGSEFDHGILIDDARLFTGEDDYPTIDEICTFVLQLDPSRTVTVADDIIRVFKKTNLKLK